MQTIQGNYVQSRPPQNQIYSAAPNRFSQASNNQGPPTLAPRTVAQVPVTNSSQYANAAAPLRGMPNVGSNHQPASTPTNASKGQQALSQNNAYVAQHPQLGIDASDFFSLPEQELDEVLASLANPQPTSQQNMPTSNAAGSQAAQLILPSGAAQTEETSHHPDAYVMNAPPSYGNVVHAGTFFNAECSKRGLALV